MYIKQIFGIIYDIQRFFHIYKIKNDNIYNFFSKTLEIILNLV